MGAKRSIALVIRTFNEERHIGRLLTGATHQSHAAREIVVVDSGSNDATISIATQFPSVRVVTIQPDEFSFGRALNRGIAACSSDVAVFASAHVYPLRTSWLESLVDPFDDPDVVISYGRQVGEITSRFSEQQVFKKWFPAASGISTTNPFNNNANAAIRIEWWRENPYDEELTGLEDVGAGQRALADGKKIAYVAEAPIVHVHEETFRQVLNRYRREAIALKRVYPESEMTAIQAAALFTSNTASDVYAAVRSGKFGALGDVLAFRSAQFFGGFMGHRQSSEVPQSLRRRLYYPRRFWVDFPLAEHAGEEIDYGALESPKGDHK